MAKGKVRKLRLDQLNLPEPQLRSQRRRLGELVASVQEVGILVPPLVRSLGTPKKGPKGQKGQEEFAVVAGAGRLQALRLTGAGPKTWVTCVVVDVDDAEATLLALVENVVREDMRPFDEAEAARSLVQEYGFTQERVALALGMSQAAVSKKLAVFQLDKQVVAAVRKGTLDMRAARTLLPLMNDRAAQRRVLARAIEHELTAAQVAALVAKEQFGAEALEPMRFSVAGAGRVDARTTGRGKLRVMLEADDEAALDKLWRSLKKRMSSG